MRNFKKLKLEIHFQGEDGHRLVSKDALRWWRCCCGKNPKESLLDAGTTSLNQPIHWVTNFQAAHLLH